MIPLLSREAVRELDLDAIQRLQVPSLVLMENAGLRATQAIVEEFPRALQQVTIIGGPGQNGGDGWVVARQLFNLGCRPRLLLIGEDEKVTGDARVNLEAVRRLGLHVASTAAGGPQSIPLALDGASVVVDALFGTGLDRPVGGLYASAVAAINRSDAPCAALDLPSGVDANTGAVLGTAVRADLTVTFAAHKRGLHQHPGAALAGKVVCASIGVPAHGGVPAHPVAQLVELRDVARWLPPRPDDAHKGTAGDLLVVAGSPGRTGAALLSGLGALRSGAGLVTLASRGSARDALDAKVVELMTAQVPMEPPQSHAAVLDQVAGKAAAVVGPGLGLDSAGRELARLLAETLPVPAVFDADALTAIGTDLGMLKRAAAPRVLTPHPGEAARLLATTSAEIQADRYRAAASISNKGRCVTILKGARTVIAGPEGELRVCDRGTPALGVAGTGDVLSGMVGAVLASLPALDAATAGVVLHALAGELAARSDRGLLAREVADAVPAALEMVRQTE